MQQISKNIMNIKKYGYKIIYTRSKQKIRNEFVPRKGMNRLLMKRRSTISWKPPPAIVFLERFQHLEIRDLWRSIFE